MARSHHIFLAAIFSILTFFVTASSAEDFCVSSEAELQAALDTAAANGEDDLIKIVQGVYRGNFSFSSIEPNSIEIRGGYFSGCTEMVTHPAFTILDGEEKGRVLLIEGEQITRCSLVGITFQNGSGLGGTTLDSLMAEGGAVRIAVKQADLSIDNCVFIGNKAVGQT